MAEYVDAQAHLEQALSQAQSVGLTEVEAEALRDLGIVALYQGRLHQGNEFI